MITHPPHKGPPYTGWPPGHSPKQQAKLRERLTEQQRINRERQAILASYSSPPNRLRRYKYKLARAYVKLLLAQDHLP